MTPAGRLRSGYASHLPSADQLIPRPTWVDRSFLSGPPNAGTRYIPVSAPERRWKAICVPSGDQAAQIDCDGCCVKRSKFSLWTTFTYKSAPFEPVAGSPVHAKAICDPSGENAGQSSDPG